MGVMLYVSKLNSNKKKIKKKKASFYFFFNFYLFMIVRERERGAETQAEGEAGSMHREPDVGFDPGSPGSALGQRQAPNRCATQGSQESLILNYSEETQSFL